MSNIGHKLSELPAATPIDDADLLYIVQGGVSKQISVLNLHGSTTKAAILAALGLTNIQVTDTQLIIYKTGVDLQTRRTIIDLELY